MKTLFKPLLCLAFLLGIISCDRNFTRDPMATGSDITALLTQARSTFTAQITNSQARAANTGSDQLTPAKWQPQWQQAQSFKFDGKNVLEMPLLYDNQELVYSVDMANSSQADEKKQHNGVTKAIFFKHSDGTMEGYVLKFVLDKDYKIKAEKDNKKLSLQAVGDFNGYLVFSNWKGETLDIYQYKNGRITSSTKKPGTNPHARLRGCNQQIVGWYWACITVYYQCCTEAEFDYDPGSVCCSRNYKYCTQEPIYDDVCTPETPSEPDPNDNGGNETGGNADVENQVSKPCVRSQVDGIINANVKNYVQNTFNEVFNNTKGLNMMIFQEDNSLGKAARTEVTSTNPLTIIMHVNSNFLADASK